MRSRSIAPWMIVLALPTVAVAQTPVSVISSAGPITDIYLGDEGSQQVVYQGGTGVFYPADGAPSDSGTFILVDGNLYAPDFDSHSASAVNPNGMGIGAYTPYLPLSQSAAMGQGTVGDPFRVVTVYGLGDTGVQVTQTDTYALGEESYLTTMVLENTTMVPVDALVYRAGDCTLDGDDSGFGFADPVRGSIACTVSANNDPPAIVLQFQPITAGSTYLESTYQGLWGAIGDRAPFPNDCLCTDYEDNAIGIAWEVTVPAMGESTLAHTTNFTLDGPTAVQASVAADRSASVVGATNGYTVTFTNANEEAVTLTSILTQLGPGFSYVNGTTSGSITADPTINGATLQWDGAFVLAANGSLTFRFGVTVASAPGMYFNTIGGVAADGFNVVPSANAAPISVVDLTQRADAAVRGEDATPGSNDAASPDADLADAGVPLGRDATTDAMTGDTGLPEADSGVVAEDSGVAEDASEAVDSGEAAVIPEDDGGCGCTATPAAPRDFSAAVGLLLGLALVARRRR